MIEFSIDDWYTVNQENVEDIVRKMLLAVLIALCGFGPARAAILLQCSGDCLTTTLRAGGQSFTTTYTNRFEPHTMDVSQRVSGVNYFFGLTTTISPGQRQLPCGS